MWKKLKSGHLQYATTTNRKKKEMYVWERPSAETDLTGIDVFFLFQSNIGYIFNKTGGYWALVAVDIDFPNIGNHTLLVVGDPPSAPVDFSYKCSRSLRFQNGYQNGSVFVELSNIQVFFDSLSLSARNLIDFDNCSFKLTCLKSTSMTHTTALGLHQHRFGRVYLWASSSVSPLHLPSIAF